MCTVVVRRSAHRPPEILAVRDELTTRDFAVPDRWWPEHPEVVGGRDEVAGGTWCATHVGTGATALVLNRYHERRAAPGAPSRGVLPLLAAVHGDDWGSHVRLDGMAGFVLVLAAPGRLSSWTFDGDALTATEHPEGTVVLTSGGPEDSKAGRWRTAFAESSFPDGWRTVVQAHPPAADDAALLVRRERDGQVFASVFAETIDARPGRLHLEYSRRPWTGDWTVTTFTG